MTRSIYFLILALLGSCSEPVTEDQQLPTFYESELFHDVQMQQVFEDSKTFVDCIPKAPIDQIIQEYRRDKANEGFQLKAFVSQHFSLPSRPDTIFEGNHQHTMMEHIENLWPRLTRKPEGQEKEGSLIALPHSYVVPGGRFSEVYYWDSYFTMIGLMQSGREKLVKNMLDNFAFLIDSIGHIPNGNRTYYTSRSQPPFFAMMVELYAQGNDSLLLDYLPQMEKEYAFWMDGMAKDTLAYRRVVKMEDFIINRYWDDDPRPRPESYLEDVELAEKVDDDTALFRNIRAACESGWDFSSRWMTKHDDLTSIHTTDIVPVDLNCLLYKMELIIAKAYELQGRKEDAVIMDEYAAKRRAFIVQYCWDESTGYYYDFNLTEKSISRKPTLAGMFPLFVKITSNEHAHRVKDMILSSFLHPGGVLTTLEHTQQQWDAPNGWAPLQWVTVQGLMHYGYDTLATEIADRWLTTNKEVYSHNGKLMEKYNVMDTTLTAGGGEYPAQDGFGWTNGVAIGFKKLLSEKHPTE